MNKLLLSAIYAVMSIIIMASCSSSDEPGSSEITSPPHTIEINDMQRKTVLKGNKFAFKAWEAICDANEEGKDANQFFSPLSLQMAMSMVANGSDGQLLDDIINLYSEGNASEGLDNLNALNRKLLDELPLVDKNTTLAFANSLWCDINLDFDPVFASTCAEFYDASSHKFETFTEKARHDINKWCRDNTNGMIDELYKDVPEDFIIMMNATYFKGKWKYPFSKKNTHKEDFTNIEGETIKTDMMVSDDYHFYGRENEDMVYVELPYQNGGFQMNIVMPKENADFDECVRNFAENKINWNRNGFVKIILPKFELEPNYPNLIEVLANHGVPSIYNLINGVIKGSPYRISTIKQMAKIKTDEEGSEAAALTVISIVTGIQQIDNFEITINRPFFFTITEQSTGAILFMGKVAQL